MSAPRLPRTIWSAEQDMILIEGVLYGMSRADLAAELGRTTEAVMSRINVLRTTGRLSSIGAGPVKPRSVSLGPRPRRCLCCGKVFASQGAQNRMCGYCRTKS